VNVLRIVTNWISKHRFLSLILVVVLFALVYFASNSYKRSQGQLTEPLKKATIAETVYGIGTIVANQTMQIRPGQVLHIDRYNCKEGDYVKKGDVMVVLDHVPWRAPFSGTITNLPFKIGENVFAQGPILTLTDLTDRYMTVSLEQQGALRVRPGQKVKMSFDTIREESYDGIVRSVYSNESNFLARIDVSDLPKIILPGMTADVGIIIKKRENALLIPIAAISDGKVWVKRGKALPELIPVNLGIIDKDMAELISGDLSEGDRILIKGVRKK
jgi:macrolide-specific efflux system membrane fusion protein